MGCNLIFDLMKSNAHDFIFLWSQEHVRRAERKNRDAFRTLLEEHVAAGILTAKTYWLDYCIEVSDQFRSFLDKLYFILDSFTQVFYVQLKDLPQYQAVASNMSGSTPKDLFEDITEELEKQVILDQILYFSMGRFA